MAELTTLLQVQTYMADSSAATATLINAVLPGVCRAIETFCNRKFALTLYEQFVDGEGGGILYLPQYPIVELRRIMLSAKNVMSLQNTSADAISASCQVSRDEDKIFLNVYGGASAGNESVAIAAKTCAEMKIEIEALMTNWSVSVLAGCDDIPCSELIPFSGVTCLSPTYYARLKIFDGLGELSTVESSVGRIEGNFGVGRFWIEWTAGYEIIPADLGALATRLCANAVRRSSQDTGKKSERWADYAYTAIELENFASDTDIAELLKWRRFAL